MKVVHTGGDPVNTSEIYLQIKEKKSEVPTKLKSLKKGDSFEMLKQPNEEAKVIWKGPCGRDWIISSFQLYCHIED